jgi:thiosulfate reductase cytochrome b subunit
MPRTASSPARHSPWVRAPHWIAAASFLTLAVTGVFILMVHPRLYWGAVGNDLTPALLELPIGRNHRHAGWAAAAPFFPGPGAPASASRTYDIFNQNSWGRSLHFLAGWVLVAAGAVYVAWGALSGHFRRHLVPGGGELTVARLRREVADHLRLRAPPATGGPHYGLLQKCAYAAVVFVALPLMVLTGFAMSPALTAALPALDAFGGYQSARTLHFVAFVALLAFLLAHVVMVARSGFRRQMRAMTVGGLRRGERP